MNKKFFLSFFLILFAAVSFSQVTMSGKIIDKGNNDPMSYVNVALFKDGKLAKGTMSNDDGVFTIEHIAPGLYTVQVSFMGYVNAEKKVNITGKNPVVNAGKIFLTEDTKQLKEVEVVSQGSQVKFDIDKKVFSVDQSIAAAGGDATEVLQNIPSVEVSNDGDISLRNNSNVEVWINGKPSGLTDENRAQILEQISAGSIQSVEVITNPSAKYSPEGSAGIINLVMKKDRKAGYYGSVTGGLDHPVGSDRLGEQLDASVNFNTGKWDGSVSLGARNTYKGSDTDVDRYYKDASGDTTSVFSQNSHQLNQQRNLMTRLALNYQLNKRNSFGFSGFVMGQNKTNDNTLKYTKTFLANDSSFSYKKYVNTDQDRLATNTALDHVYKDDSLGIELRSSLSYSYSGNNGHSTYTQSYPYVIDQKQNADGSNQFAEAKSDFSKKHGKSKYEAGVDIKYQQRTSTSSTDNFDGNAYVEDNTLYNKYKYAEQLYALYGTYGRQFHRLSVQLGLRGEYIIIDNSTNGVSASQKSYFEPFPTIFLSYSLPKGNEFQFNYTRRINRPRGKQLNSFKDLSDSTNISYGNPDLSPELASSFEFNYIKSWTSHTFSTSAYYRYTDDIVQSIQFLDKNNILNTTYMNVSKSETAGLEFVLKDDFAKWFSLTSTLDLYYDKLYASDFDIRVADNASFYNVPVHVDGDEDFTWTARMMANFMFTKTFTGQLTANYSSPHIITQGTQKRQYSVDLGLKKTFCDKKFSLALAVRDVFDTRKIIRETSSDTWAQYYESTPFGPDFRLTATYNFGNSNKSKGSNRDKSDKVKEQDDDQQSDDIEDL